MAKTEKVQFILEQVRLCLDKKDFVRATILSKKISPRTFMVKGAAPVLHCPIHSETPAKLFAGSVVAASGCWMSVVPQSTHAHLATIHVAAKGAALCQRRTQINAGARMLIGVSQAFRLGALG